jgi:hypothetical protein
MCASSSSIQRHAKGRDECDGASRPTLEKTPKPCIFSPAIERLPSIDCCAISKILASLPASPRERSPLLLPSLPFPPTTRALSKGLLRFLRWACQGASFPLPWLFLALLEKASKGPPQQGAGWGGPILNFLKSLVNGGGFSQRRREVKIAPRPQSILGSRQLVGREFCTADMDVAWSQKEEE